ncbi:MAG TPA: M28 family peptidase [Gemmatimonadales bacterium]|nr:M28 family peptidase [Gemmatimonadales bacterium]
MTGAFLRPQSRRAGLVAGALALGACVAGPGAAQSAATADTAALMRDVRVLAADSMEGRRAGTPGGLRARAWLVGRIRSLGLDSVQGGYEHRFSFRGDSVQGVNLLGLVRGTAEPDRYVVISAHYDHVGVRNGQVYNGADDNASGTAAVLALARAIREAPLRHSVIFAWLDAEEMGLQGARAFVAAPPVPRERIVLNVNLDMVGHSDAGELFAAGTSHYPELRPALDSVAAHAPIRLRFGHDRKDVPAEKDWTGDSDHGAFHAVGIPFIYFGVEDHQDYHKPSDDPETLTPAFYGKAVATIETAVRALDRRLLRTR